MARYQLSPQALRSLTQISDYTLEQFGRGQQKRYLQSLRTAMQATADNPGRILQCSGRQTHVVLPQAALGH